MNETEKLIASLRNQKKQLLDNALDGIVLSTDDQKYLSHLVEFSDTYEVHRICNLLNKVRLQGLKQ